MPRRLLSFLLVGLSPLLHAATELRLLAERESLTGRHAIYRKVVDGMEVVGERVIETRRADGVTTWNEPAVASRIVRAGAASTEPSTNGPFLIRTVIGLRAAWRTVVASRPLEPYAHYFDIYTGELLRREPLFFSARARVFDPNPVIKLNDPSLHDGNDSAAAVPASAYDEVDVVTEATGPLRGNFVEIAELQVPVTTPPDVTSGLLLFNRSQREFEDVNAYFHIDRSQRYLRDLGFVGSRQLVAYPIPVDAHAANGTDNSYFIPTATPGRGALYFGDGGTDDAEDSDLLLHEFAHAIQEWISPGTFTGLHASQSRALGEGFGDYWAFSGHYGAALASGRDPSCIAAWDARCWMDDASQACGYPPGSDCLRRVDSSKTMADYSNSETVGTEHRNGEIWASALRQIFLQLVALQGLENGRRIADRTILESHFGTPLAPTFASMAHRLLDADRLLNGGANTSLICAAMTQRGILSASTCSRIPRGEEMWFATYDHDLTIPDQNEIGITASVEVLEAQPIERLYVAVDIRHQARGDLRIELVGPDGTVVVLQEPSRDRSPDLRAIYGLDVIPLQSLAVFRDRSSRGIWRLRVIDVARQDVGVLRSWNLIIQFRDAIPMVTRPQRQVRQIVPVVAHLPGANGTFFQSDVRLFNRATRNQVATLILTPTGADGRNDFAAIQVELKPGHNVLLTDIVSAVFRSTGGGQLEIATDNDVVIASARTYTSTANGTLGQLSLPIQPVQAISSAEPQWLTHLRSNAHYRTNIGVAEMIGAEGRVRIRLFDDAGSERGVEEIDLAPHSHRQIGAATVGEALRAEVSVISGSARVAAYGSVVDNRSADPYYVPATVTPAFEETVSSSAIGSVGANGTNWRTEFALASTATGGSTSIEFRQNEGSVATSVALSAGQSTILEDLVRATLGANGFGYLGLHTAANVIPSLRVVNDRGNGSIGELLDWARDETSQRAGDPPRYAAAVEISEAMRTNIGIIETSRSSEVLVRLSLRSTSGVVLGTYDILIPPSAALQIPATVFGIDHVANGFIRFDVLAGDGRIAAYTSTVDNRSGDFLFMPAR